MLLGLALTCLPVRAAVNLSTTVIRDSSIYTAAELFAVYERHLGKPVTPGTADTIAGDLRNRYRDDGYSRPGYTVLDNGLETGIVRIELTEASISGVNIEGKTGPHRERLDALFSGLPSDRSLRPEEIRNVLQQARRLPGLDVNVSTQPDELGQGGFVLKVDSDYQTFGGSLTYTNRGTEQIGRNLLFGRLVQNGVLGGRSSMGAFVATAENANHYSSGGLFLRTPLAANGATMLAQGSVATVEVLSSSIVVDQDRERFLLKVTQPLPDWSGHKLSAFGAFEMDNLDVFYDAVPAREDRLRTIQTGVSISWRGGARQHLLSAETELGLNGFGGRLDNFANPGDGRRNDFVLLRLQYVDLTRLDENWSLRIDGFAQHSPHVLPSIKRFKVGGGRIGRGFDAAALAGDRGLGGKVELRRRLPARPTLLERLDVYGFYDIGAVWSQDRSGRESAASTGFGLTLRGEHLGGYIEVAQPLTHADADGEKDPGLFVELTGRF